jgi:TolA-binding protein
MSLLMEALRKAEEANRRAAQGSGSDNTATPSLSAGVPETSAPAENTVPVDSSDGLIAALQAAAPQQEMTNFLRELTAQNTELTKPGIAVEKPETNQLAPATGQAKTEKFEEALAEKKSARALFDSKIRSKSGMTPQKRMLILGSTAALTTVAIIGSWLVLILMDGSGNQYAIPPLAVNEPLGAPITPTASDPVETNTVETNTVETDPVATESVATDSVETLVTAPDTAGNIDNETDNNTEISTTPAATAAVMESAASTAHTSASATLVSMQAPPTTSPALAQNTPAIDPETGLYELPLDADQSPTESVTAGSPSPIRISRSEPIRNPDMQVLNAWSAYQQGDYAAARILYQQFLARDPDNRDALLGVAATAMQQGDMISARQTYNHLLGLNPRDVLARTGLLETTSASDPVQRETELKTLQIDHPDIAAVSYSLGNLYAGQQRWHDAQQAYYEALLIARTQDEGAVSPDYAFNLAISLERINQPEAALTFYREARALAVQQVPGFDMATLDQRLRALERSQP